MAYQVPTYNQRLKRVNTIEDLRDELAGVKRYLMRLRKAASNAEEESALRQLRRTYFGIET